jgi:hypothetical protein
LQKIITKSLAVLGGAALILGVLATIIQIVTWLFPKGPVVQAQGAFYPIAIPQPLLQRRNTIITKLQGILPSDYSQEFTIRRIMESLDSVDSQTRLASELSNLSNFVVINVSNTGNQEAKDLRVDLPTNGLCEIRKVGEETRTVSFDRRIDLGNLRPRNNTSVTIWPTGYLSDFEARSINVQHSDGVEDVEFAIAINGKSALPYRYPGATGILGILVLLGTFLLGVRSAGRVFKIPFLGVYSVGAAKSKENHEVPASLTTTIEGTEESPRTPSS